MVIMKVMKVRRASGREIFLETGVLKADFSGERGFVDDDRKAEGGRVVVVEDTEKGARSMQMKTRTAETMNRANIQFDAMRARSRAEYMSPGRATVQA